MTTNIYDATFGKPPPDHYADLQAFITTFNSPTLRNASLQDVIQLAEQLIIEEVKKELLPALARYQHSPSLENLVQVADGLVDSVYVLIFAAGQLGLPWDDLWREVQRSNMSKVWPDGTVHKNEYGKVMKPPGFKPPDLWTILHNWESQKIRAAKHAAGAGTSID